MRYTKQKFLHKPEEGSWGDCQRTVIACLMDLEPDDVPHFIDKDNPNWYEDMEKWLQEQGLVRVALPLLGEFEWIMAMMKNCNPDILYMLMGKSKNDCHHVVIAKNDEIIWDPSIDNSGIVGPCDQGFYWLEFLLPTFHKVDT